MCQKHRVPEGPGRFPEDLPEGYNIDLFSITPCCHPFVPGQGLHEMIGGTQICESSYYTYCLHCFEKLRVACEVATSAASEQVRIPGPKFSQLTGPRLPEGFRKVSGSTPEGYTAFVPEGPRRVYSRLP